MAEIAKLANTSGETYLVVQTRSVLACVLHWVLFFSVATLAVTGFYIADPKLYYGSGEAYQAFAMANVRTYHFIAAAFMVVSMLTRLYLSFTPSCHCDAKQVLPTFSNIKAALKLALYYTTLKGEHAHYRFVNPLGGLGIFMIALALLVMTVTGGLLYAHGANPAVWGWLAGGFLEDMLGGQQSVRNLHHVSMYALMFFVIIHVYMQIWKNSMFTEADIASIIAGYKVFPLKDIGHFADRYGIADLGHIPTAEELDKLSTPMPEGPGQFEEKYDRKTH